MRSISRNIWSESINFPALFGSRLWTPINEKAWWDASDTSTITVISNEVRVLAEKTGNSPDLTAFAGYGMATGTHSLNSLNMLYNDGSEAMATYNADYEVPSNGDFAISQLTEVFLPLDNVADGMFSMLDAGGVDWQFVGGVNVNGWNGRLVANEMGGTNTNFSPAMGIGPSIYTLVFNFTASNVKPCRKCIGGTLWRNGHH
jgi:hypothetical protein